MNSGAASLNRILGQPITGWSLRQLPYRLRDLFSFFAKQGYEVIHTHRMAGIVGYNSSKHRLRSQVALVQIPSLLPPRWATRAKLLNLYVMWRPPI